MVPVTAATGAAYTGGLLAVRCSARGGSPSIRLPGSLTPAGFPSLSARDRGAVPLIATLSVATRCGAVNLSGWPVRPWGCRGGHRGAIVKSGRGTLSPRSLRGCLSVTVNLADWSTVNLAPPRSYARRSVVARTLIVIGESVLAATTAIQSSLILGVARSVLITTAACSLIVVVALWWLYFDQPAQVARVSKRRSCLWGYGPSPTFAAAAVGAGLQAAIDTAAGTAHISTVAAGLGLAVPLANHLLGVWGLHLTSGEASPAQLVASPLTAALVLASTLTPWPLPLVALLLAARVVVEIVAPQGEERGVTVSRGAAAAGSTDAGAPRASDKQQRLSSLTTVSGPGAPLARPSIGSASVATPRTDPYVRTSACFAEIRPPIPVFVMEEG